MTTTAMPMPVLMAMSSGAARVGGCGGTSAGLGSWARAHAIQLTFAVGAFASAAMNLAQSMAWVNWTGAQLAAVAAESTALVIFTVALLAHLRIGTPREPVALVTTLMALITATLALGSVFSWWELNQEQSAAMLTAIAALVGIGSAAGLLRTQATPGQAPTTPPAGGDEPTPSAVGAGADQPGRDELRAIRSTWGEQGENRTQPRPSRSRRPAELTALRAENEALRAALAEWDTAWHPRTQTGARRRAHGH